MKNIVDGEGERPPVAEKIIKGNKWSCKVSGDESAVSAFNGCNEFRLLDQQGYITVSARSVSETKDGDIQIKGDGVTLTFENVSKAQYPLIGRTVASKDMCNYVTLKVPGGLDGLSLLSTL